MDMNVLTKQLENVRKLTAESKALNATFENTMNESIKNAPESDKLKILELQKAANKAFTFAKKGDINGALDLLKNIK